MLRKAVELEPEVFSPAADYIDDRARAYVGLASLATAYLSKLRRHIETGLVPARTLLLGRVRGTGAGVSFGKIVSDIEGSEPTPLRSPFEGSHSVAGAVIEGRVVADPSRDDAFLKLRFEAGSIDLPMHAHEQSDRIIFVLSGRGYYHVSSQALTDFTGEDLLHIPVRERDVLMFPRGTIHTFSTDREALFLLSYHAPYVPLDDPTQYTVPDQYVLPARLMDPSHARVTCDPAWTCLA